MTEAMPMNHSWATVPIGGMAYFIAIWTLLVPVSLPVYPCEMAVVDARVRPCITRSWVW